MLGLTVPVLAAIAADILTRTDSNSGKPKVRQEYAYKPVAERKTYSDAGLPPNTYILTWPGHPWTIDRENFKLSYSKVGVAYADLFTEGSPFELEFRPFPASRGESLPIVMDADSLTSEALESGNCSCIVLRLNGTVDLVRFDSRDRTDVLSK